ncbi:guanosine-3',5'-bis(diphosphate) 3'-pyrophosphohydrolase MESH1 [Procambarus clarkii]|uniref:guanosine-3',5'-bis(diphosphate) 3'-pyrophosphohydrolase MESH1 n=1 Tax=Procambarus clarkii TaxID=6728 RepID=UPI001E671B19|nr:guanosine-3',5'-bis(diphosphate) 3'-pyrophosphohydrolase MESH1-like [Procambarus clarkii]
MASSSPATSPTAAIIKCVNFAAVKHKDQKRKDPERTPYINHPIGVAYLLVEGGVENLDVLQAALLHDTVEDTQTTLEEILNEFGPEVAGIVAEVTDNKTLDKQERKRLQIVKAATASNEAKLVKLADKLYNLRDLDRVMPENWTQKRVEEYFHWAAQVVAGCRGTNVFLEKELDKLFIKRKVPIDV